MTTTAHLLANTLLHMSVCSRSLLLTAIRSCHILILKMLLALPHLSVQGQALLLVAVAGSLCGTC